MNFVRYFFKITIPTTSLRILLWTPVIGGGLYYYSQYQQYAFMDKLRERDLTLKLNASSIFSENNLEYSNMVDITNQEVIDPEEYKDNYTVVYSGQLSQFKLLMETIEEKLANYNLKYLYVVNQSYYDNNKKYLETFQKINPKKQDLTIAYGNSQNLESDTIYCILNDKIISIQQFDDNNLNLISRTLSLKINKDLEKLFVKQIDF